MLAESLLVASLSSGFHFALIQNGREFAADTPGYGIAAQFDLAEGLVSARALPTFGHGTVRYEVRYRTTAGGTVEEALIDAVPSSCVQHDLPELQAILRMCGAAE